MSETSVQVQITIIDDTEEEEDETVILMLPESSDYDVGSIRTHTVRIIDNDKPEIPVVNFVSSSQSVDEDVGIHIVEFRLTQASIKDFTLNYRIGGTATMADDYTSLSSALVVANQAGAEIPIIVIDDRMDEPDETVIFTITDDAEYDLGDNNQYTLTIRDNDPDLPVVNFSLPSSRVVERNTPHTIEVRISPPSPQGFTLMYDPTGGDATRNVDYTTSGFIDVTANAPSVKIPIEIIDDTVDEDNETVILTLTEGSGYNVGNDRTHRLKL